MEFILVCSVSVLSLLVSAVYLYRTTWGRRPLQQLPPAPPGWPVIGHLHLLSDMPHQAMAELAKTMRAPLLRLQLGTVRAVVISKPDVARAALTTNDAALASRPHLLGGHFLAFGSSDVTFAPAGPYHRTVRRVVVSELLSARRVATYQRIRVNEVRRLLGHLAKNASVPDAPPVDLSECVLNLANDVLFRVAFGRGFPHDKAAKLGEVFAVANDFFAGFTTADFFPELEPVVSTITGLRRRLKNCFADLCEFCDEIIDELISGKRDLSSGHGGDEDFIDALLRVQKSQDMEVPLVGNSPTLSGESGKAWFIWLRVQPLDRLAFWGSVGPRDLKPVAIRAGVCVAARQLGWARRLCGRPRRTRRVSAIRFQQLVSEARLAQCILRQISAHNV
jgi:tryptamine 5-hydroxylase